MIGPGTDLDGFVIESMRARGGMGVVYRARQTRPDRVVALKVIASELADDPQFRSRFQREAAIAAEIEHPNVIPVHAVGEAEGTLFIAMRFIEGSDLRRLLAQEGRLEPTRAVSIVDQVAQALDAAHARGLVHRDVKPANVLVSSSGGREHVYLTDFGLSRHIAGSQGLTGTGAFLGTIDYVAPEQALGERVDARADVYSLGCVLFHCLTGTVPYLVDNDLAKLYAHASEPPPSVLERTPDLPRAFESVLARAMAKDPDERYPSAGDLGRAALAASHGTATVARERTVAKGDAAPPGAGPAADSEQPAAARIRRTSTLRRRLSRRSLIWVSAGGVALALAVALVLLIGGGAGQAPVSTLSLTPVPAQNVPAIPGRRPLQTVSVAARGGYRYRVTLATVNAPRGSSPRTQLPLYLTLMARRGAMPFVVVQQLMLPSAWRWTASSILASFTLDPNPDGSGQLALSWFVVSGDRNDVTHYLTVGPQGIQID